MPTENKNKSNTRESECYFCGGQLLRQHDHWRIGPETPSGPDPEKSKTFCGHTRCIQAIQEYTVFITALMEGELDKKQDRRPGYFG